MKTIDTETWKQELLEFKEKTKAFYAGEMDKGSYKGFSGYYGSYAQRGGKSSMLRLRITAGRLTKEKMAFTAEAIRKYHVKKCILPHARQFSFIILGQKKCTELWKRLWMQELSL